MLNEKVNELTTSGQKVKLHLGCGPFLFDGYINVDGDYIQNPNVVNYDISVTPYPLSDNSVDEILSVHVIEHIERWLIEDMLTEWLRILKPGGKVITEWPDTLKACKKIVESPNILLSEDRRDLKSTMFVFFFDDSRYDSDSMIHRWGYSEQSLGETFKKYGFSSWRSELNQYKKSNIDSRIVAFK
jgi:SAM-dependent methyltransferase